MNKQNLKTVEHTENVVLEELKNESTIRYAFSKKLNENPKVISFWVYRNQEGEISHGVSDIEGSVSPNGDFPIRNYKFQPTDIELYGHIYNVCQELLTPEVESEVTGTQENVEEN